VEVPSQGLVIREPFIGLVLAGRKTWEMRSRSTRIRGPIALIRSGSGLVVGTAQLIGCGKELGADELRATSDRHCIPLERIEQVIASRWVVPWELRDAQPLAQPIPSEHPPGAVTWVTLNPSGQARHLHCVCA
jgi:ASCH domain